MVKWSKIGIDAMCNSQADGRIECWHWAHIFTCSTSLFCLFHQVIFSVTFKSLWSIVCFYFIFIVNL